MEKVDTLLELEDGNLISYKSHKWYTSIDEALHTDYPDCCFDMRNNTFIKNMFGATFTGIFKRAYVVYISEEKPAQKPSEFN